MKDYNKLSALLIAAIGLCLLLLLWLVSRLAIIKREQGGFEFLNYLNDKIQEDVGSNNSNNE